MADSLSPPCQICSCRPRHCLTSYGGEAGKSLCPTTRSRASTALNYVGIEDPAREIYGKILSVSDEHIFGYARKPQPNLMAEQ